MSDLNYDVDAEIGKYIDAYNIKKSGLTPSNLPLAKRRFNPVTNQNDVVSKMENGGYFVVGSEPIAMTEAPTQPQAPLPDEAPTTDIGPQVESLQQYVQENLGGKFREGDLEAAGYSQEIIDAAGYGTQPEPMFPPKPQADPENPEPLDEQEIAEIIASGQPIFTADPTLRDTGSQIVSTYLFDLAAEGLRSELEQQYAEQTGQPIPPRGSENYPRSIDEELRTREGELLRNAEVYSNALFGTGATGFEVGAGDFLTAGVMDIQEGYRVFNQQRDENGGTAAGRAIGVAIMAAGIAEATGVGLGFGKLIKSGVKALEPTLVRMGSEAQQRIDAEGATLYSNPVGPIVDRGLAAAGRLVAPKVNSVDDFVSLASVGQVRQARTVSQDISDITEKKMPATVINLQGADDELSIAYESGEITDQLTNAGLFVDDDKMGTIYVGTTQENLNAIKSAENPAEIGKLSGYSDADIAAFYLRRRGGNAEAAFEEYSNDLANIKTAPSPQSVEELRRRANIARFGYDPNDPVAEVKAPTEAEPGIIAFHGSGADFDEFKLEKIGTGEGSQAYGYGLYFTDTKSIAEFYKDAVREESNIIHLDGKPIDSVYSSDNEEKFSEYINENFDPDEINDALMVLDNLGQGISSVEDADSMAASSLTRRQMELYNRIRNDLKVPELPEGKMYEVMINIQPDDLLDYDKPLSSQSKQIQSAALKAAKSAGAYKGTDKKTLEISGGALLADMVNNIVIKQNLQGMTSEAEKIAAQELFNQGIPGIKYFDNASRNTADGTSLGAIETEQGFVGRVESTVPSMFGPTDPQRVLTRSKPYKTKEEAERWIEEAIGRNTRNYVVFDDKLINIMKKYGIVGPVAVTAMKSEEQEET